jgi:hypothetical protein
MDWLNGILTQSQKDMGMSLREDDHCVELMHKGKHVAGFNRNTVTFATIQVEAHQHEQWLKSGIEVA